MERQRIKGTKKTRKQNQSRKIWHVLGSKRKRNEKEEVPV